MNIWETVLGIAAPLVGVVWFLFGLLVFRYHNQKILPSEIIEHVLTKYPVEDIRMKEPTIEEIVEKYYVK